MILYIQEQIRHWLFDKYTLNLRTRIMEIPCSGKFPDFSVGVFAVRESINMI